MGWIRYTVTAKEIRQQFPTMMVYAHWGESVFDAGNEMDESTVAPSYLAIRFAMVQRKSPGIKETKQETARQVATGKFAATAPPSKIFQFPKNP